MSPPDEQKTILMIEDDLDTCDFVAHVVERSGYAFHSHNRMEKAIEKVDDLQPDLILLDIHLPDGSGLQFVKNLREKQRFNHIPVFVLTTREYSIEREVAYQSGATLFLQKPIDRKELMDHINNTLSSALEMKFWGVRGSTPCANPQHMRYGGNTTCVQLFIPGNDKYLILDAGSGLRNLGNELIKTGERIHAHLFITHAHWDHIQGFPFFKPLFDKRNRFDIHMPEQLSGSAHDVLAGQMSYTYFPVTPDMLQAELNYITQDPYEQDYGAFSIDFMLSNHPVTTAIFRIKTAGRTIVFCPDNELIPEKEGKKDPYREHFFNFIKDADLLVHDAQYDMEIYPYRRNFGHSAWEEAVEVARQANVKHLYLTHHDPDSDDDYLKGIESKLASFDSDFESVQLAREHSVVRLSVMNSVPR